MEEKEKKAWQSSLEDFYKQNELSEMTENLQNPVAQGLKITASLQ